MLSNPLDLKECPDCASTNIGRFEKRDQIVCRDCGLIFEPLEPETEAVFEKTHGINVQSKAKPAAKAKPKKKK
jgi:transcription initiation factor TFIIIB Brf1 subunit/transcription initiation factor TFIIB